MKKYGSSIYSILKIDGFEKEAFEYRAILAKTLETKEENKNALEEWIKWLMGHPIPPISKYLRKYDLQVNWIDKEREKLNKDMSE